MKKILLLILVCCYAINLNVSAQVTIAPIANFIDDRSGFGTFTVINNSDSPKEITIDMRFGFPTTDSLGVTFVDYDNEELEQRYSIASHVRIFPRAFILQPDQRQSVRVTVRPPADMADGTYFSRIAVGSVSQTADVEQVTEGVGAIINFRFEQMVALFYKKGNVNTGIEISDVTKEYDSENQRLRIISNVFRTGNSPFLGSFSVDILDENSNNVASRTISTTAYFDVIRVMEFENLNLRPGNYTANLRFVTQRSDIPQSDLVQMDPKTHSFSFTID